MTLIGCKDNPFSLLPDISVVISTACRQSLFCEADRDFWDIHAVDVVDLKQLFQKFLFRYLKMVSYIRQNIGKCPYL